MGQSALILSVAATLTILILLVVVGRNTKDSDTELASYHFKVLTREISTTGLNMTVRRLVDEPYQWSNPAYPYEFTDELYRGGTFTTTATGWGAMVPNFYGVDQDTVDVVSTGRITTTGGGDTTHVIEARYVKGYIDLGLPPGLRKAVFADSILDLNGGVNILHTDPTEDAHIHGNDQLSASGANNNVEGFGTVSNDPPGDMSSIRPSAEAIFDPVDPEYDPATDDLVWEDDPIYLPPIDASVLDSTVHADAGGHYHVPLGDMDPPQGNETLHTLNLNNVTIDPFVLCGPTCGTADNPMMYYVPGNLDVNNIVIKGHVQFVVEGVMNFQGSVTGYVDADGDGNPDPEPTVDTPEWDAWIDAQLDAADNTTIGYFIEGQGESLPNNPSVKVAGNFTMVGQIYSNGDIELGGGGGNDVNIIGGITSAEGSVDIHGGITIRFAMLSESVLTPGLNYIVPEGIRLIAWAEW
ncbi:MAG: hypothetical protein KJO98_08915 [Rhodothermia bacterium]|nr:hypothetical protein [Rhodothermia bacterium]